jgi:hypothetical protein
LTFSYLQNSITYIVGITILKVNPANCLIKNLYEIDSLPYLKIYTKESGTVSVKITGGSNEVNAQRETESDKDHSGKGGNKGTFFTN